MHLGRAIIALGLSAACFGATKLLDAQPSLDNASYSLHVEPKGAISNLNEESVLDAFWKASLEESSESTSSSSSSSSSSKQSSSAEEEVPPTNPWVVILFILLGAVAPIGLAILFLFLLGGVRRPRGE